MTSSKYTPVIGLEIHAELKTASKMFCGCVNNPDEEKPNVNICPICLGHPGTLPVLNKEAIRNVLKVGLAVDGTLADFTEWDRKNYFYPDIPKGYQISQYKYPLVSGGIISSVEIERIHLEEDTAQSTHDTHQNSLVNFNRAGVPLMELVTKPVIHDAATAVSFAKELRLLLRYLGAGEANLEKGEMRVEANISVGPTDEVRVGKFGTKTEVKNLNSFRAVEQAIAFEIERQTSLLEAGERVHQETRGWDENSGETFSQRSKESSHDYRYFPDPDIPKLKLGEISEFNPDNLKKELPELPWIKRNRFVSEFGMTEKEVAVFIDSPSLADYFESIIESYKDDSKRIKLTVNYLLSDYLGLLKKKGSVEIFAQTVETDKNAKIDQDKIDNTASSISSPINPSSFSELINLVADAKISSRGAKDILNLLVDQPTTSPLALAEKNNLIQNNNSADILPIIDKIITDNPTVVAEYKAGKTAVLQFLIGQAMKVSRGSANPEKLRSLFVEKLG